MLAYLMNLASTSPDRSALFGFIYSITLPSSSGIEDARKMELERLPASGAEVCWLVSCSG